MAVPEHVLELHRIYLEQDETLASVGARIGTSHEGVRQLFLRHGLRVRSREERTEMQRAETERKAEDERERIIALYKRTGTIDAVLAQVNLPRSVVAEIVNNIPDRERYRKRRVFAVYSRDDLIAALQRAKDAKGEPLTIPAYRIAARELGLPAWDTIIKHWYFDDPEEPWLAALQAAGIQGNPSRGKKSNSLTFEQCVDAVAKCLAAHGGKRVPYPGYRAWAVNHDVPSGPSVRKIVGWNLAVELALDKLAARDIT